MFCSNCGKKIPDGSHFCNHCGKATSQNITPAEEITWEYCQIAADFKLGGFIFTKYECMFWANALGKKGSYNAGASPVYMISAYMDGNPPTGFLEKDKKLSATIHSAFVKQLVGEGWEPTGERGQHWWMLRFKRKDSGV